MENLWPQDIEEFVPSRLPVTVLKEQAAMLGQRTKNIVEAHVRKGFQPNFAYSFLISASSFSYQYVLLRIEHEIEGYPVKIFPDTDIKKELGLSPDQVFMAKDEATFLECLKKIFNYEKVKRVIAALLAQVQETTEL
jgi:hypothetical protein